MEQMKAAALALTNDSSSVRVICPRELPKRICAAFTMLDARQADVVDRIGRQFWQVDTTTTQVSGFHPRLEANGEPDAGPNDE